MAKRKGTDVWYVIDDSTMDPPEPPGVEDRLSKGPPIPKVEPKPIKEPKR